MGKGVAITSSPVITADWEADGDSRWTVPLGLDVSQILELGPLPVKAGLSAFHNVERPRFGPDWELQFTVQFLFPK